MTMAMEDLRKLILKFPALGENPFTTLVSITCFSTPEDYTLTMDRLKAMGALVSEDTPGEKILATFETTNPAKAEETVRTLASYGFQDPKVAAFSSRPSLEGK